ncbi:MAG TPA: helix-hairpin-helix domain-containing protein [Flavitalea sp.]|nr:helix-hairpin-helix domain-containing protein [Flavitalea sp.]
MVIDNYYIADQFSLLSKLMDIHGENSFKSKTYSIAAFNIEKLTARLSEVPTEKIFSVKGIGDSVGKKIIEILNEGHLKVLEHYIQKTPPGLIEMLSIKGLGPKKIAIIWKEMEIETIGELLYACHENRLARFKGFGEKTQKNVEDSITFYLKSQGSHLYAEIESYALTIDKLITKAFSAHQFQITGSFRRQSEIIEKLEWVTTASIEELDDYFQKNNYQVEESLATSATYKGRENISLQFYSVPADQFYSKLFETSCSEEFLQAWNKQSSGQTGGYTSEEKIFDAVNLHFIPPFIREKDRVIGQAKQKDFSSIIQPTDIKGIIHNHSTWSDGSHTIEQMAQGCIDKGYEYLVISDHSKSAFYAKGLSEEQIQAQHQQIDELNAKLAPFKIFKSIESDILNDGSLDYPDKILATFDLVIASVHSNLKMSEEKAMMRLVNAISNPYTTILGHMTGRLLLSRPGYPVNYEQIIDACVENNVTIEINANPRRLDMDWRWIDYALEKGALFSIDPDAHSVEEFDVCRYGVLAAQKGGLTKERNLSSFSLREFEEFLARRRMLKVI